MIGRLGLVFGKVEVLAPDGRSVEDEQSATLEDPIDDELGEVLVVEEAAPGTELLVGGEDHRAFAAMTLVDDVEEHVGGMIAPVRST